jgi:hypothetical protein
VPPKTTKQIVAIAVRLEVNTPDQLKRVIFGLTKGTDQDLVTWKLEFEYHERESRSEDLVKIVDLVIDIKTKNAELVEKAATKGFTKSQAEFAVGPAASAARRLAEGKTTKEKAARIVERTFSQ